MFNNYFINVADNLAEKIPKPNTRFQDYLKIPMNTAFTLKKLLQRKLINLFVDSTQINLLTYMEYPPK